MKDFVTLASLGCVLIGTPLFFIGRMIEKGDRLMTILGRGEADSSRAKLGDRLFWMGAGLFTAGLVLMLFVLPNL